MAKSKVAATPAVNDGRVSYRVMDGVERVNGIKVSGSTIPLLPSEALYDLALGRIELVVPVAATPEVASDGGN